MRRSSTLLSAAFLLSVATTAAAAPDPCLRDDRVYAAATSLWEIDTTTGAARKIGDLAVSMPDIAIGADGRLFGASINDLYEVSTCDASITLIGPLSAGYSGLSAAPMTGDLIAQGPPLVRLDPATAAETTIGGAIGDLPPLWCGRSAGDLALGPEDGLLYSTQFCGRCSGGANVLARLDPATGDVIDEIGCLDDQGPAGAVWGLTFDHRGCLWGSRFGEDHLMRIDPKTASTSRLPIIGGFDGQAGLAAVAGLAVTPEGLGNTLLAVRDRDDVVLRWIADQAAVSYNLYRSEAKEPWPTMPFLSDLASAVIGLSDVAAPESYLYRVTGVGCSGAEGP